MTTTLQKTNMLRKTIILAAIFAVCVLSEGRQICTPGQTRHDCICSDDGTKWTCTEPASQPVAQCEEGKAWKRECNDCICKDGEANCTLKDCASHSRKTRDINPCLFNMFGQKFHAPDSCVLCYCKSISEVVCDDYDVGCFFKGFAQKFRSWVNDSGK